MIPQLRWTIVLALVFAGACGEPAPRKTASTADTVTEAAPPPEPSGAVNQQVPNAAVDEEYVVHGVCPFECCKYGDWTLIDGGALRTAPGSTGDSVASLAAGATVHTDSGVMVLHPPGLAVIVADTSAAAQGASGPPVGDTVELLSYTRQKTSRVRWQGQELEMTGRLRVVRDPIQRWWVYMTDPASGQSGWLQVGGVNAAGIGPKSACGGH